MFNNSSGQTCPLSLSMVFWFLNSWCIVGFGEGAKINATSAGSDFVAAFRARSWVKYWQHKCRSVVLDRASACVAKRCFHKH